jgi:carbonic anhydrase/acetyltransferase-like protein (isoleucine patch superfamily)
MGAVLMNGCKIGKNSIVGAGTIVTEGKEFPDNTLIVGAPARAIRTLDRDAIDLIRRSAEVYARRCERYQKEFRPVRG